MRELANMEFGSDFHFIDSFSSQRAHLTDVYHDAILLADGRQCMVALIRQYGWKRMWIPEYFCYEVITTIAEQTGITMMYYPDLPGEDDGKVIKTLPYQDGDVLFRVNYFGMRNFRSNKGIPVPVIEDHSHDLLGRWALYSDADWCIASLRKSLPLPEGGMMWSPKRLAVDGFRLTEDNERIAAIRWEGMEMKAAYLRGDDVSKDEFRKKYTETEEWFDTAEPTLIDERTSEFVCKQFDLNLWLGAKRKNWALLNSLVSKDYCKLLKAEHESCTMFSLVLLLDSKEKRDTLRKDLIDKCVYPAILWNVPETASEASRDFSQRMLSIHCDGRYTEEDISQLAIILNQALEK